MHHFHDTYRPLIEGLTVKDSKIEGLGLFTTINIKKDTTNDKSTYGAIGIVYHNIGDYDKALECLESAYKEQKEIGGGYLLLYDTFIQFLYNKKLSKINK